MIKGYFPFYILQMAMIQKESHSLVQAGLGNLLQQPQLTFLILPALQWIMMHVLHIAVASIIVLLQTH